MIPPNVTGCRVTTSSIVSTLPELTQPLSSYIAVGLVSFVTLPRGPKNLCKLDGS